MGEHESTSWSVVEGAAAGREQDRETFARVYMPVVRRYLSERWREGLRAQSVEDAVQEVLVECLRPGGAITRLDRGDGWAFRAYLYGVARNVARGFERRARTALPSAEEKEPARDDDSGLGRLFDRAFVRALLAEALQRFAARAEAAGGEALRRAALLRARVVEDRPIRELALEWGVEAADLHHQYARARREYRRALEEVLEHHLGRHSRLQAEDLLAYVAGDD